MRSALISIDVALGFVVDRKRPNSSSTTKFRPWLSAARFENRAGPEKIRRTITHRPADVVLADLVQDGDDPMLDAEFRGERRHAEQAFMFLRHEDRGEREHRPQCRG